MKALIRVLMGVRNDLPLSERWWHRLARVLLIFSSAAVGMLAAWIAHLALTPEAHQRNFTFTTLQEYRTAQPQSATRIVDGFVALPGQLGRLNEDGSAGTLWDFELKRDLFCSQDVYAHVTELVAWEKANTPASEPAPTIEGVTADLERQHVKLGDPACVSVANMNIPNTSRAIKWRYKTSVVWKWRLQTAAATLSVVLIWVLFCMNAYYRGVIYVIFGSAKRKAVSPAQPT